MPTKSFSIHNSTDSKLLVAFQLKIPSFKFPFYLRPIKMSMMNFAICFLAAAVVMVAGNPGYGYKPMAPAAYYMAPSYSTPPAPAYQPPAAPSYSPPAYKAPAPAYTPPAASAYTPPAAPAYSPPAYSPPAYSSPAYSPPAYSPPAYKASAYMAPAAPSYNKKSSY